MARVGPSLCRITTAVGAFLGVVWIVGIAVAVVEGPAAGGCIEAIAVVVVDRVALVPEVVADIGDCRLN